MKHGMGGGGGDKVNFYIIYQQNPIQNYMVWCPQCGKNKTKAKFTIENVSEIHNSIGVGFWS